MINKKSNIGVAALLTTILLVNACDVTSRNQDSLLTESTGKITMPRSIQKLLDKRAVDRNVLFAEVTLRYNNSEIVTIANRQGASETWSADLRIPRNTPYELEITWYDTADVTRLNLVTLNRNFEGVDENGSQSFDFSEYDFDGYDDDQDGITNLAEREAGTLPLAADVVPTYVVIEERLIGENDGLEYIEPGVVDLRVTGDDDSGSYRAMLIDPADVTSDFIGVKVAFLEDSVSNGTSEINLVGIFFNTLAERGPESNEGDVITVLQPQLNQDGSSRVLFCAQVRDGNGGRVPLASGNLQNGNGPGGCSESQFSGDMLSFEKNQELDLEIGVLRETNQIYFQFNGDRRVFDVSTAQFQANQQRPHLNVHAAGLGSFAHVRVTEIRTEAATDATLTDLQNPSVVVIP